MFSQSVEFLVFQCILTVTFLDTFYRHCFSAVTIKLIPQSFRRYAEYLVKKRSLMNAPIAETIDAENDQGCFIT
jgi:hypothetical protein